MKIDKLLILGLLLTVFFAGKAKAESGLKLSLQEAILKTLENNQNLQIERLNPQLKENQIDSELGKFEPRVFTEVQANSDSVQRTLGSSPDFVNITSNVVGSKLGISTIYSTGTTLEAGFSSSLNSRNWAQASTNQSIARLGFSINQAILRGRDQEVNLANLQLSELEARLATFQLISLADSLVFQAETSYWELYLAKEEIKIYQKSVELAENQLSEAETRVEVGILPEIELIAARAELAMRRQILLEKESSLQQNYLTFCRLLNLEIIAENTINLIDQPFALKINLKPVSYYLKNALANRIELKLAQLELEKGQLAVIKTKDGLLPKLDLLFTAGKSSYSEPGIIASFNSFITGNNFDILAMLRLETPLTRQEARAEYSKARISHQKAILAVQNLEQLVILEVQTAYLEILRYQKQIQATQLTYQLQAEKLTIESEKFKVGKATSFNVAQAQRDLLQSEIDKIRAQISYVKSITNLYRSDGSLLTNKKIATDLLKQK